MSYDRSDTEVSAALAQASEEFGLPEHYRDCVRPILNSAPDFWPECCGGNCEPCSGTLVNVARRVIALVGPR